mmetsp:Transcript_14691/g.21948  ORF Transcript_14691/g.21948 Transcript_14691/m.21948 type:complete len:238 (-) Transcript_14691:86-799(-)
MLQNKLIITLIILSCFSFINATAPDCVGLYICPQTRNTQCEFNNNIASMFYNKCNSTVNFQLIEKSPPRVTWLKLPAPNPSNFDSLLVHQFNYLSGYYALGAQLTSEQSVSTAGLNRCIGTTSINASLINYCPHETAALIVTLCYKQYTPQCPQAKAQWITVPAATTADSNENILSHVATASYCEHCQAQFKVVGESSEISFVRSVTNNLPVSSFNNNDFKFFQQDETENDNIWHTT